jgi:hypothetical protein
MGGRRTSCLRSIPCTDRSHRSNGTDPRNHHQIAACSPRPRRLYRRPCRSDAMTVADEAGLGDLPQYRAQGRAGVEEPAARVVEEDTLIFRKIEEVVLFQLSIEEDVGREGVLPRILSALLHLSSRILSKQSGQREPYEHRDDHLPLHSGTSCSGRAVREWHCRRRVARHIRRRRIASGRREPGTREKSVHSFSDPIQEHQGLQRPSPEGRIERGDYTAPLDASQR